MQAMQQNQTLEDLLSTFAISASIASALYTATADNKLITIEGVIIGALALEKAEGNLTGIASRMFQGGRWTIPTTVHRSMAANRYKLYEIDPPLWEMFVQATSIRQRTGGRDHYLGLRHLLFVLQTSNNDTIRRARSNLSDQHGYNVLAATLAIAEYCLNRREPQERLEVWKAIFDDSLLGWPELLDQASPAATPDTKTWATEHIIKTIKKRNNRRLGAPPAQIAAETTELETPLTEAGIAVCHSDDPRNPDVIDRSGAKAEAKAFARMIAWREFKPPLAVGVFGDWGSGKSFFIESLRKEIAEIKESARDKPEEGPFLGRIAEIHFNAWHYAETNLWASLVDHIFTELSLWNEGENSAEETDKLFNQLALARALTIDAAGKLIASRQEQAEASAALSEAKQELAKQQNIQAADETALMRLALDKLRQGKGALLDTASKALGLGQLDENVRVFSQATTELIAEGRRSPLLTLGFHLMAQKPWSTCLAITAIAILPLAVSWVTSHLEKPLLEIGSMLSSYVALISGAMIFVAKWSTGTTQKLAELRGEFEKYHAEEKQREEKKLQESAAAKAAAEENVRKAHVEYEEALRKAQQAEKDFSESGGRNRVLGFIRDRINSGEYSKHLGFIALIRKDFERLNQLLAHGDLPATAEAALRQHAEQAEALLKQAEASEQVSAQPLLEPQEVQVLKDILEPDSMAKRLEKRPKVFERIVLYIDDLDRCPREKVIDVLQAVHLLLAFRLFVVFVAVDVRWLRSALAREYAGHLDNSAQAEDLASASDYLEKIFQIPYWVRPMNAQGTAALLADHLGRPSKPVLEAANTAPAIDTSSASAAPAAPIPAPAGAADGTMAAKAEAATAPPSLESLQIGEAERGFIDRLAAVLDGSPRRSLRFINVYRIIKASMSPADMHRLEQKGHTALLTLLAMTVAADDGFPQIAQLIENAESLKELRTDIAKIEKIPSDQHACITRALAAYENAAGNMVLLKEYIRLVGRFSFQPVRFAAPA